MAGDMSSKPIHALILDAGPIITNTPPISTLLRQSTTLLTTPSVISEIRDAPTRARFETTWQPFIELRNPKPESLKFAAAFARKTGDYDVLSRVDLELLALAYEVECENNGGDWRLRRVPGQKGLNGSPPVKKEDGDESPTESTTETPLASQTNGGIPLNNTEATQEITNALADTSISGTSEEPPEQENSEALENPKEVVDTTTQDQDSGSDSDGWITPSNLRKHQNKDASTSPSSTSTNTKTPTTLQAALLTADHALQNTALLLNLNLLNATTLTRIRHLKTHILRCHACFKTCRDSSKQFCPTCGKPTLTRVTCTTDAGTGEFKLHLKKNMQWNNRGERFSIPKPVAGRASGKLMDGEGGKGGWGSKLVLAEDQKEYVKAVEGQKREKKRDLLDEDVLPSILSGDRGSSAGRSGGRIKVGAGKGINGTRRR